jgi:hypothetical protein
MKIETWKPKGMSIDYESPEILAELRREDEVFGKFVGAKKVRIAYGAGGGMFHTSGTAVGRVVKDNADRWVFMPARHRRKGWYLTLGVRAAFQSTIVVKEIDEIDRKRVRGHWSLLAAAEYLNGIKTVEEIEAEIEYREAEPKPEPSGMPEKDFFGTLKRLRKGNEP